jgi:hypothetical protein
MRIDIKDLQKNDRFGLLVYTGRYEKGYVFYEVCGLQEVQLHWQTVNWLCENVDVERKPAILPIPEQPTDGVVNYLCGSYILSSKLIVRLEFEVPCKWVGMTIEEAEAMSEKLLNAVKEIKILEQI